MYKIKYDQYDPVANSDAIVQGDKYRFTILTSKLVRIEYSESNQFEDAQTKMVLNRNFQTPDYKVYDSEHSLKIVTKDLIVKYNKREFSPYGLSVELNGEVFHPYKGIWHYGDKLDNLKGTKRTLDFINGSTELEPGLMSKYGISVIDDSDSPVFLDDGWFQERQSNQEDLYVFAYKRNYLEALNDYYELTGHQPKLPRYALGNWWSRYYPYSEESYLDLMNQFENEKIPFSVAVIDMDWHLVDIPEKYGSKWTGYTWNKELFPKPERFLRKLKDKGYATTLNIHPAAGVRPFEDMYKEMAEELNIDWENEEYIDFDPYSENFLEAMFKYIYHPNEKIGVDFWWMDWQQSPHQLDENNDPLWILNHYHYGDNQKNNHLGLTFSRYFGPGSHRYPIGFSGDTVISWETLDFQPYFTATASNIGYGWWSHDIGGHRHGIRNDELMLRWVQFGVFSPINRLHSADSPFLMKEPWNYNSPYDELMRKYLRLRHKLIPYLYTMNVLSSEDNLPLIQPMYYKHPYDNNSYNVPNQYYFGTELIVCPLTEKTNSETLNSHFKAWLPEGNWYDLQTGLKYVGNRMMDIYRTIDKMGLFLKEGSIIPLTDTDIFTDSIDNPEDLSLLIGYGNSGEFLLREDFVGKEKTEESSQTKIAFNQEKDQIIIHAAEGNLDAIPEQRSWKVKLYGVKVKNATVKSNSDVYEVSGNYVSSLNCTIIDVPKTLVNEQIVVQLNDYEVPDQAEFKLGKILTFLKNAQTYNLDKEALYAICNSGKGKSQILAEINSFSADTDVLNAIMEIILA
ncbi:DUF4968 domain-containing protein [Tetragenococcus koreensis]|uniref:glycoside hydrolase family 31 protein n=1 Tax=Tetragenococcus koreensis TaxID=290335 RepID=UPI0011932838|nr:glycoside hydrolase family 31 protein [Tetragenococcus koreensis]MCF1586290.1 DUF4968 domain-containing protein [Tetragenococcus koreensis]MCF1619734.1 DUF4968 domain-containing protein [Tetragenococcus koreensis]MCF1630531.1 DUF4968 domain-containing protein [Tetragenococcus koreensis]MCF1657217.1 DUF4968 domain-containing protein [Tetragenococcus koreensis]GEN91795.1 alpha-xylosidase [Tetragenococcus koreensis]